MALPPRKVAASPSAMRIRPIKPTQLTAVEAAATKSRVLDAAMRRDGVALLSLLHGAVADRSTLRPDELDAKDASGRTALLWSCEYSEGSPGRRHAWAVDDASETDSLSDGPGIFEQAVDLLLELGADAAAADNHGSTPLLLSAFKNSLHSLDRVLESGGDGSLGRMTSDGRTPLMWAVAAGAHECAARILELGGDPNHADARNVTSLMLAAYEEGPRSFDEMETVGVEGAAEEADLTLVQMLLRAGARVDAKDATGRTPLFFAVMGASRDAAFELLEAGAQENVRDDHGVTPLLLAVDMGDDDMVRLLLSGSAACDMQDAQGRTPLAWAAYSGFGPTAMLLLEAGADPSKMDDKGMTPLMLCAYQGHAELLASLLDYVPDDKLDLCSADGRTALLWASAASPLTGALSIRALLLRGADVAKRTSQGSSALLLAAHKGNVSAVVELIAAGAELATVDSAGRTALHRAVLSGGLEVVAALCAAGASVSAVDKRGRTALNLAENTDGAERIYDFLATMPMGKELGSPNSAHSATFHE